MFELEQALTDWRQKLISAGVTDVAILDELEAHLRDEIEAQSRLGIPEPEAFKIAAQRMGKVEPLRKEFRKRTGDFNRAFAFMSAGLYFLVAGGSAILRLGSFADVSATQQASAIAAVVIAISLILGERQFARILPLVSDRHLRTTLYGAGILCVFTWVVLFYRHIMTRVEWDMSQLLVGLLWGWTPMAALCSAILAMERAAEGETLSSDV